MDKIIIWKNGFMDIGGEEIEVNSRWMGMWFRKLTGENLSVEKIIDLSFMFKNDKLMLEIKSVYGKLQYSTYPDKAQEFLVRLMKSIFEDT